MKKTLNIGIILGIILIPTVVSAAWYNPFSWFKKTPTVIETTIQTTPEAPVKTPEAIPAPKPIITNTITVADPKLQAQINTLLKQNADLQTQLVDLTGKYNALVATNADLNAQITSLKEAKTSSVAEQTPKDQYVNVLTRDPIQQPGNIMSWPLTITNQSDSDVTITAIQYELTGNADKTNVSFGNDLSNPVSGSEITYQLNNSLTIGAYKTTTVYINVLGLGFRMYLRGFQSLNQSNVHFSF